MERFNLTAKEKVALEQGHNSCRYGKEQDRIKAVLLRSEGLTLPMLAQALRIHKSTVASHINYYLYGKLNLASGDSECMLVEAQAGELVSHLTQNTYRTTPEVIASYTPPDGDSKVNFLSQLRKYSKIQRAIHLVLDQAGYHRCLDAVTAAAKLSVNLVCLPSYSPNFSSIERLWKVMNEHARNNKFFKTADDVRQSINDFLKLDFQRLLMVCVP